MHCEWPESIKSYVDGLVLKLHDSLKMNHVRESCDHSNIMAHKATDLRTELTTSNCTLDLGFLPVSDEQR